MKNKTENKNNQNAVNQNVSLFPAFSFLKINTI